MCGIVGIITLNNQKINESTLIGMRDAIKHRGPDDEGIYINEEKTVGIGHRRLSIIDLSPSGHQPMGNEDRSIWITYNGEVYNFLELRHELKNLGYTFKSNSDTEVILKAYQMWGEESFKKLNGMFAFCIYDKRNSLLYLVRDHAGIKPLYYSFLNGGFIFSSEVKTFKVFNREWIENPYWKIYFLIFGHIPEPYTTLKDVYMLPKGSFLRLNLNTGKYDIEKFIEFNFSEKIKDLREAVEKIRYEFPRIVERHLISDAPVGVFLSGGIDSSIITVSAHKFQGDNLRTLSVVFNEKEFSEETYQAVILNKINSRHNSYLITEMDFMGDLDDIFSAMDQPTIDGVNTYFISKCASKDGLKTVLSGIGGDELFGGYPSFSRIDMFWFLRRLNGKLRKPFSLLNHIMNDKFKKLSFLSIQNPISYYLLFRALFTIKDTARLLNIEEKEVSDALEKLYMKNDFTLNRRNFVSYLETNLYMQNQILKDSDFMSMWHSIEVRVPFLDKEFMELVFSIDENIKFNRNISKFLLTKAFEDILPEEIVLRKKQGFTFPFDVWIRKYGKGFFEVMLLESGIHKKQAKTLWDSFEHGKLHWSRIWGLIVLREYEARGGN